MQLWPDGSLYQGSFFNNLKHGHGRLLHANGNVYEGNFEQGVASGLGTMTYDDGTCYVGQWANDCPQELPSEEAQITAVDASEVAVDATKIELKIEQKETITESSAKLEPEPEVEIVVSSKVSEKSSKLDLSNFKEIDS